MSARDMKEFVRAASVGALKTLIGFGIATALCGNASAQAGAQSTAKPSGLVMQKNLSLPMAKTIAEAALAECQAKGYHTAVAVVDRAGQVLVILRDELATAQHADMARRKAYTARMFRLPTSEFQKRTADPSYAAQRNLPDVLALGGGVPIRVGDETIGGVASAGSTQEQDEACAKAGLGKVMDLLK